MAQRDCTKKAGKIIEIDERQVRAHVGEVVRTAVEETLNTLLSEAPRGKPRGILDATHSSCVGPCSSSL